MEQENRPRKPRPRKVARARAQAKDSIAAVRKHYRAHLITKDGVTYNPLLDDPDHPDNRRHWKHGTWQGNTEAGCRCPLCREAASAYNRAAAEKRLDKRLAELRARIAAFVAERFPDTEADEAVELVMKAHRVSQWRIPVIKWDRAGIELALRAWNHPDLPSPGTAGFEQLVDDLLGRLGD